MNQNATWKVLAYSGIYITIKDYEGETHKIAGWQEFLRELQQKLNKCDQKWVLPVDVETGLDTTGCDDEGPESSGNLMTGLACDMESSSNAVIRGPLVAKTYKKIKKNCFH